MKKWIRRALLLALIGCMAASGPAALGEGDIVIPDVTVRAFDIPDNEAMAFLRSLGAGWNLGNTMDATDDHLRGSDLQLERYWCGVMTTRSVFEALADAGFCTVRIPVSWHNHVSGDDFAINGPWLDRVQELVDWALGAGLNVIVNTHHDVSADFYYPDADHLDASLRYMKAIWTQVSARFAGYDERLIFESMNEPRLAGTDHEWWFESASAECLEAADCINQLNQAFVDTVRAGGGMNATRYLMVPGYDAAPANTNPAYFRLPEDSADNRIIVSAHAYLPYSFALDTKGGSSFSLDNLQQTGDIGAAMNTLYERFISRGIPVVMGEYGALNKNNLQDRVDLTAYYVASASARGIPCLWWDNNAFQGRGENFGLLNRAALDWPFPEIVEAIMRYALKPAGETPCRAE